ncbi:DsbA family protein [Granulicella tundricola]|uniref:DsbA family protein n=1 Tax=Granulicella tundricola TaxID=940615 RepID=UPI0001DB7A5A|nr:thioredoxin domain-containing protein [Granulicella tundricola]
MSLFKFVTTALLASAPFAAAQTSFGNPAAPVSIVAFVDLECPFSAETLPHLEAYAQAHPDQVRLQLRQFPLEQHVESRLAHEAALAAGAQGKYLEMVDLIQANQRTMTRDQYLHYAEALHLDLPRFTHDLDTHRFLPQVIDEVNEGNALGVTSTPTLYINGKQTTGAQTLVELSSLIQQADYIHKADAPPTVATEDSAAIVSPDLWKQMLTDATQALGPSDAPITVVEFTDFQCPVCRRSVQPLHDFIAASGGKIRWIYRSFPLDIHENSQIAAEADLAAGAQGKFWPMHDLLFAQQDTIDRANLDSFARQIGLDLPRFQADLTSGRFRASIATDRVLGNKAGVDGTPAFFINCHFLSGARSLPEFQQAVALATQQPGTTTPATQLAAAPPPPDHLIAGTFNAPNTILWFSDVEASAAPAIGRIIQQLIAQQGPRKETQLRVILKSYALPDHPAAALTHRASWPPPISKSSGLSTTSSQAKPCPLTRPPLRPSFKPPPPRPT